MTFRGDTPAGAWRIKTIEAHAAGEPLRVVISGFPPLPGRTILEKRRYARDHYDHLRRVLMWEPRGHADMYGCLLTEPEREDSHLGVLFLHNEGFSTMCGHGVIGLVTVALEYGLVSEEVASSGRLNLDTPAGQVKARAEMEGWRVKQVSFENVPSFVVALDLRVDVPGLGQISCDVAFGGAFYAVCRAEELGVEIVPERVKELIDVGMKIKKAVGSLNLALHPFSEELNFIYGTIIVGESRVSGHHSRNVCIFADGEVDRSPTGTGVSARAAILYERGELGIGDSFLVESIIGSCFQGKITGTIPFGSYKAVIPEISGSAWVIGESEWFIDPDDPLAFGFLVR